MESNLTVVTLNSSPFDLQLLYVPKQFCASEDLGKYTTVELDDSSSFLCRVFEEETLQKNCCMLEKSVQSSPRRISSESTRLRSIKFIPSLKIFKTVKLVVVLYNIEDATIWKNRATSYLALVKQLLRLFVVSTGSTLNLDSFEAAKKLGIKSILVRDAGTPNPGKVVASTKVILSELLSWERFSLRNPTDDIEIPACSKAYKQLAEFVRFRKSLAGNKLAADCRFSQLMVVGPGGCGKKTLIRKVALESDAVLVRLDCTKVTRPKPGDTEALIGRTFDHALSLAKEGLTILLLLHLETVCHKPGRIVDLINNMLDSVALMPNLIVATSSSDPTRIHESLKSGSRLNDVIHVGAPNEDERAAMLKILTSKDLPLSDRMYQDLAQMTPGYVMADLSLIVNNTRRKMFCDGRNLSPKPEMVFAELKSALSVVEPSALRGELGVVKSGFVNTELGGLHHIKETLFRTVLWPLQHAAAFEKLNIKRSSGVLLYGPPGCAKTSLARTVAAGSNVTFLAVSAADLYSPFVGDTERTIASLFQRARAAAPTLLFIDEIDTLVGNRDSGQRKAQERVLSSFLIEMDGIGAKVESEFQQDPSEPKVIIVAATNRPNVIDAALLRPGRLDKLIHVPPPDVQDRQDILNVVTKMMPLDKDVDLLEIAKMTYLHSGADLSNLCREAAFHAMTSRGMNTATISQQDFLTVLSKFEPSLNASMVQWYKDFCFS